MRTGAHKQPKPAAAPTPKLGAVGHSCFGHLPQAFQTLNTDKQAVISLFGCNSYRCRQDACMRQALMLVCRCLPFSLLAHCAFVPFSTLPKGGTPPVQGNFHPPHPERNQGLPCASSASSTGSARKRPGRAAASLGAACPPHGLLPWTPSSPPHAACAAP